MLVLHANWTHSALHLWAESLESYRELDRAGDATDPGDRSTERGGGGTSSAASASTSTATMVREPATAAGVPHRYAASVDELSAALDGILPAPWSADVIDLRLPAVPEGPLPSERLAAAVGAFEEPRDPHLTDFSIRTLRLAPAPAIEALLTLETLIASHPELRMGHDLRYWAAVARFVLELLEHHRFIPTLIRSRTDELSASWRPWLLDDRTGQRVGKLLEAMPPVARAVRDLNDGQPWSILQEALDRMIDAAVRSALVAEEFFDAVEGRDPHADLHVAWLHGLLGESDVVTPAAEAASSMVTAIGQWIGRLDETGRGLHLRLALQLHEPEELVDDALRNGSPGAVDADGPWRLTLHLQSIEHPRLLVSVDPIWRPDPNTPPHPLLEGEDDPQELMLTELGRAARLFPVLERALEGSAAPRPLELSIEEAYAFLREFKPILEDAAIGVVVPEWWNQPTRRLGARLEIDEAPEDAGGGPRTGLSAANRNLLGLDHLVSFRWRLAVGDELIGEDEFKRITQQAAPLVRLHGQWVELREEDVQAALELLREQPEGTTTLREAIRMTFGFERRGGALPVLGMDAEGWVGDVLEASVNRDRMPVLDQPEGFLGSLRPYQQIGLSWLAYLDRFGLGCCLADDMGLGKTIQLIALLLHERQVADGPQPVGPTLLIVPTSVIANWQRELHRFGPTLKPMIHHGPERLTGDDFLREAPEHDVVITTYGLISRDRETLIRMPWRRVVLDEAQYIKNPPTKQTAAIRALRTDRRIALTGTPLENRLSELWSIMEFCNPGYLGSSGDFRRRFSVPIERHRDDRQAQRLRELVQPFILRRLKTDPTVIQDLPDLLETKEFATLTPEQAGLYERVVGQMLSEVERAEGMQRRGLVLSTLVKLKQICNHPAQYLKEGGENGSGETGGALPARSGKAQRLIQMLEEVIASGDKALVFTQFRQMGHLLQAMIQHELDREVLFLHGGTPSGKRQKLIDRFQADRDSAPVFVLSLKAGGVGINLTAANHVFHFDRWWNPAVEKQATDRAFRIGQTRRVQVHKFVCLGTLEERIDQMIEQKTELAENIIGAGEQWLTELNSQQLRDMLILRQSALEGEE